MNILKALNKGYNLLKLNKINTYKIDTELLLSDSLNITREDLLINFNQLVKTKKYENYLSKLHRRKKKEPIAYILRKKEFWKNNFYVNKDVLIPRPETEFLVEESLKFISKNQNKRLLEIGIGSGCIITSVLKERKNCIGVGIDCCEKALKIAKNNVKLHQIENRIKIFKSDVDNFNTGKYDLIISNPPYIDKHQLKYLGVSEFEPCIALNGGVNGTEILKKVIIKASQLLKINGKLIIEIGSNQKYKMINLLNKNSFFINKIIKDFSSNDRCIVSTKLI
tara:strand:- start:1510 stop:2349 length:840 start_codon:yes stop_codon:yes gene_type:complete